MATKNPPRLFEVQYATPHGLAKECIHAAYWSIHEGISKPEVSPLTTFKDGEGKPVLAVALSAVVSIREIRDVPVVELTWDELRIASVALVELGYQEDTAHDSDTARFRREAGELGRKLQAADRIVTVSGDPVKDIVEQVQKGILTIEEAREQLLDLPWGGPEDGR